MKKVRKNVIGYGAWTILAIFTVLGTGMWSPGFLTQIQDISLAYVTFLFLFPPLLGIIIPRHLSPNKSEVYSDGLLLASFLSVVFYFICWTFYLTWDPVKTGLFSSKFMVYVPLGMAILILGIICCQVAHILMPSGDFSNSNRWPTKIINWICSEQSALAQDKVYGAVIRLSIFFAMFLSLTYLFGFAVAFNDIYLRGNTTNSVGVYVNPNSMPRKNETAADVLIGEQESASIRKMVGEQVFASIRKIANLRLSECVEREKRDSISKVLVRKIKNNDSEASKLIGIMNGDDHHPLNPLVDSFYDSLCANRVKFGDAGLASLSLSIHYLGKSTKTVTSYKNVLVPAIEAFGKNNILALSTLDRSLVDGISNLYAFKHFHRRVSFNKGKSKLRESDAKILAGYRNLLERFNDDREIGLTLNVTGRASKNGKSELFNKTLSQERAKRVFETLDCNSGYREIVCLQAVSNPGEVSGHDQSEFMYAEVLPEMGARDFIARYLEENDPNRKKLNLLEYMYFSIYTITTTGYGDILPVSPEAKLITSLENVVEVIFTVIFFTVFISAISEQKNSPAKFSIRPSLRYLRKVTEVASAKKLRDLVEGELKTKIVDEINLEVMLVAVEAQKHRENLLDKIDELSSLIKEQKTE